MAIMAYRVVKVARAREFLAHHRTTGGVVTSVSSSTNCSNSACSNSYYWTIRYQPPDGGPLTFTYNSTFSSNPSIPVGTTGYTPFAA
jgi:hypothetical protein